MIFVDEERKKEIEFILNWLDNEIKKHSKQTVWYEREDLSQDMRIKIIEKLNVLLEEEAPGFLEYVKKNNPWC